MCDPDFGDRKSLVAAGHGGYLPFQGPPSGVQEMNFAQFSKKVKCRRESLILISEGRACDQEIGDVQSWVAWGFHAHGNGSSLLRGDTDP